nr:MAG: RNA-dependent RNA polymerase [Wufeng shrew picorna-like virus 52]
MAECQRNFVAPSSSEESDGESRSPGRRRFKKKQPPPKVMTDMDIAIHFAKMDRKNVKKQPKKTKAEKRAEKVALLKEKQAAAPTPEWYMQQNQSEIANQLIDFEKCRFALRQPLKTPLDIELISMELNEDGVATFPTCMSEEDIKMYKIIREDPWYEKWMFDKDATISELVDHLAGFLSSYYWTIREDMDFEKQGYWIKLAVEAVQRKWYLPMWFPLKQLYEMKDIQFGSHARWELPDAKVWKLREAMVPMNLQKDLTMDHLKAKLRMDKVKSYTFLRNLYEKRILNEDENKDARTFLSECKKKIRVVADNVAQELKVYGSLKYGFPVTAKYNVSLEETCVKFYESAPKLFTNRVIIAHHKRRQEWNKLLELHIFYSTKDEIPGDGRLLYEGTPKLKTGINFKDPYFYRDLKQIPVEKWEEKFFSTYCNLHFTENDHHTEYHTSYNHTMTFEQSVELIVDRVCSMMRQCSNTKELMRESARINCEGFEIKDQNNVLEKLKLTVDPRAYEWFLGAMKKNGVSSKPNKILIDHVQVADAARKVPMPPLARKEIWEVIHMWFYMMGQERAQWSVLHQKLAALQEKYPPLKSMEIEIRKHIRAVESMMHNLGLNIEHDRDKMLLPRYLALCLKFCSFEDEKKEAFPALANTVPKAFSALDVLRKIPECEDDKCNNNCVVCLALLEVINCIRCDHYATDICNACFYQITPPVEMTSQPHRLKLFVEVLNTTRYKQIADNAEYRVAQIANHLECSEKDLLKRIDELMQKFQAHDVTNTVLDCVNDRVNLDTLNAACDKISGLSDELISGVTDIIVKNAPKGVLGSQSATGMFGTLFDSINGMMKVMLPNLLPPEFKDVGSVLEDLISNPQHLITLITLYVVYVNTENRLLKNIVLVMALYKLGLMSKFAEIVKDVVDWIKDWFEESDLPPPPPEEGNEIEPKADEGEKSYYKSMVGKMANLCDIGDWARWIFDFMTSKTGIGIGVGLVLAVYLLTGRKPTKAQAKDLSKDSTGWVDTWRNVYFVSAGIRGLEWMWTFITTNLSKIVRWIKKNIFRMELSPEQDQLYAEWKKKVAIFCAQVTFYTSATGKQAILYDVNHYNIAERLPAMRQALMAQYGKFDSKLVAGQGTTLFNSIEKTNNLMREIDATILFSQSTSSRRMTPFRIELVSPPGFGKSHVLSEMASDLSVMWFPSIDKNRAVYSWNNVTYKDGYVNQPVVVMDEAALTRDAAENAEQIQMVSSRDYVLEMSAIPDKKKTFTSPIILSASNVAYPKFSELFCEEALWRRRTALVECLVSPSVMDNGAISPALVKEQYGDDALDKLTFMKFRYLPNVEKGNVPHKREMTYAELMADLTFRMIRHFKNEVEQTLKFAKLYERDQAFADYIEDLKRRYHLLDADKFPAEKEHLQHLIELINIPTFRESMSKPYDETTLRAIFGEIDWEKYANHLEKPSEEEYLTLVDPGKLAEVVRARLIELQKKGHGAFPGSINDFTVRYNTVLERTCTEGYVSEMLMKRCKTIEDVLAEVPMEKKVDWSNMVLGTYMNCPHQHDHRAVCMTKAAVPIYPCVEAYADFRMGIRHKCREGCTLTTEEPYNGCKLVRTEFGLAPDMSGPSEKVMRAKNLKGFEKFLIDLKCEGYMDITEDKIDGVKMGMVSIPANNIGCREILDVRVQHFDFDGSMLAYEFIRGLRWIDGEYKFVFLPAHKIWIQSEWFHASFRTFSRWSRIKQHRFIAAFKDQQDALKALSDIGSEEAQNRFFDLIDGFWMYVSSPLKWMLKFFHQNVFLFVTVMSATIIIITMRTIGMLAGLVEPKAYDGASRNKALKIEVKAHERGHYIEDQQTDDMRRAMLKTQHVVQIHGITGVMTGVAPGYWLVNLHTLYNVDWRKKGCNVRVHFEEGSRVMTVRPNEMVEIPDSDMVMLYMSGLHVKSRDRTASFITDRDYREMQFSPMELNVLAPNNDDGFAIYTVAGGRPIMEEPMTVPIAGKPALTLKRWTTINGFVRQGLSGSPILFRGRSNRKLGGFISMGNPETTFITLITQGDIKQAINTIKQHSVIPNIIVEGPLAVDDSIVPKGAHLFSEPGIRLIGSVPSDYQCAPPSKSDIIPSPIYSLLPEGPSKPSIMAGSVQGVDVYKHSLTKSGRDDVLPFDHDIVTMATTDIADFLRLSGKFDTPPRILTQREIFVGVEGLSRVNPKTSAGLPFCLDKDACGKKKWIEFDEEGNPLVHPHLLHSLGEWSSSLEQGILPPNTLVAFGKSELRPKEKLHKTRTIDNFSMLFSLSGRKYYGDFLSKFNQLGTGEYWTTVGIDIDGQSGVKMLEDLLVIGGEGKDIDCSNFDGHLTPQILRAVYDCIESVENQTDPEVAKARAVLTVGNYNSFEQWKDTLVQHTRGMRSGYFATAQWNTIAHMIMMRVFWIEICRFRNHPEYIPMNVMVKHLGVRMYGDDVLLIVSSKLKTWLTPSDITSAYERYGLPVTTANKSGGHSNTWDPIWNLQFLKRTPCRLPEVDSFTWKIDQEVIYNLLRYMRVSKTPEAQFVSNQFDAQCFAWHHGREFFEKITDLIRSTCRQKGCPHEIMSFNEVTYRKQRAKGGSFDDWLERYGERLDTPQDWKVVVDVGGATSIARLGNLEHDLVKTEPLDLEWDYYDMA